MPREPAPASNAGTECAARARCRASAQRAPHMGSRGVVVAETLGRLPELPADDVLELLQLDMDAGIERVQPNFNSAI